MRNVSIKRTLLSIVIVLLTLNGLTAAVTSQITRHATAADFLKGQTERAVIDSEGTIRLAREAQKVDCRGLLKDVWSINTIVSDNRGVVYIGTSPNGKIIKYDEGRAEQIYPPGNGAPQNASDIFSEPDSSETKAEFTNEHIFAIATDMAGRLLAGVSGSTCRVLRFEKASVETLFATDEDNYVFAITVDEVGNIYLGTGPKGRIYRLDPFGKNPQLIYTCRDKNILALAVDDEGYIYAGSDERGIIYKINQNTQTATVLFDSEQSEVTALLFDGEENLFATATSAEAIKGKTSVSSIAKDAGTGRPDTETTSESSQAQNSDSLALKTANTSKEKEASQGAQPAETKRGALPKSAGHIYKINPKGFVTDVFTEMAVFFDMKYHDQKLLLATGNNAQLFTIDAESEKKEIAYEDKQASQITALTIAEKSLYLGCANPAKLIKLERSLSSSGWYTSELIDASQPAKWGKLQIDADIPQGCKILLSARSGNVKDPNDPTFSEWTEPIEVTEATQLDCPNARFCQYKLCFESDDDDLTPIIREVAVAHVIPNLPPKINTVKIVRPKDKQKSHLLQISYQAQDANKDALIYSLEFRKLGRSTWIELKDELAAAKLDWDTNTVEDGRYELRLTASDKRSNTTMTSMATSRISDAFVIDNTAPKIVHEDVNINDGTLKLTLTVEDTLTAIGNVSYTVNSNKDWTSTLPDDMVYDTIAEDFTIVLEDLEKGEHVVALKISDDLGNTIYKTYSVETD
jgi:hypothetical protein